jgi:tetratricopeptide (TPR) repeat protein
MSTPDQTGTAAQALAHAWRLLRRDPVLAAQQAAEILKIDPRQAEAHFALGAAQASCGDHQAAVLSLQRATDLNPNLAAAWRALGDQLTLLEEAERADIAYAHAIRAGVHDPQLMRAALALCEGKLAIAEQILRGHLKQHPTDPAAIRMLAEVAARIGRFDDAETLLRRCLDLAPSFTAARHNYALVLHRQSKAAEALDQIDLLLAEEPDNPSYRFLKATALTRIGEYDRAIELYRSVLSDHASNVRGWLSLGHACKTAGRAEESIAAYSKCVDLAPHFGEAYWSLANMKTYRFDDEAVQAMRRQLQSEPLSDEDRFHVHYALGKALEDRSQYAESFENYDRGARLRRRSVTYSAEENTRFTDRLIRFFTPDFIASRRGQGAEARDPIFIVGLPRSGSTLVEQILASHSTVEGTMELPDVLMLAKRLGGGKSRDGAYPESMAELPPEALRALGEEYLARTRVQRKTAKPYFIDKMPNNFQHAGLIALMLPNAKIIDARRHAVAACFSAYKQHFARGQAFSYDLADLGRYYADYVRLMNHFEGVLPGRIHRVQYEAMVADPEREIRLLLSFCGLPFEPACLEFHANTRAVRTASSEQVRQPLYRDAVEHWRNYERWLGPLKEALGPALAGP